MKRYNISLVIILLLSSFNYNMDHNKNLLTTKQKLVAGIGLVASFVVPFLSSASIKDDGEKLSILKYITGILALPTIIAGAKAEDLILTSIGLALGGGSMGSIMNKILSSKKP
jgi:hypothetical protein